MYVFGELPSDLEKIETSLGPPPAWFRPEQGITNPQQASYWSQMPQYFYGLNGLGDREIEEIGPKKGLRELKANQEMNKRIPIEANRYTKIDPISPIFRNRKAKFGFGEFTLLTKRGLLITVVSIATLIASLSLLSKS